MFLAEAPRILGSFDEPPTSVAPVARRRRSPLVMAIARREQCLSTSFGGAEKMNGSW